MEIKAIAINLNDGPGQNGAENRDEGGVWDREKATFGPLDELRYRENHRGRLKYMENQTLILSRKSY